MSNNGKYLLLLVFFIVFGTSLEAQTKRLKRPSSRIGVYSADTFVQESFDIYDKVYHYDRYLEYNKKLEDADLDLLDAALTDASRLLESAPNVIADLDGVGAFKQAKATMQINRAKKALKYSVKLAKKLLEQRKEEKRKKDEDETEEENEG